MSQQARNNPDEQPSYLASYREPSVQDTDNDNDSEDDEIPEWVVRRRAARRQFLDGVDSGNHDYI